MTSSSPQLPSPQHVLVTGSAGAIGTVVCRALAARGHRVRGLDANPTPHTRDSVVASITDAKAVAAAMQGIDTVLHLAAYPNDADFESVLLQPNVLGVYRVLEAAVAQKVRRVVLASSIQVVNGLTAQRRTVGAHESAPTNHYGLFKWWAEECGRMYSRLHGLEVLAVRIGWFPRLAAHVVQMAKSPHGKAAYFSHDDAGRFFTCAVESPMPEKFAVVCASSRPPGVPPMDLEPARRVIGYEPADTFPAGVPDEFRAALGDASLSPPRA